MFLMHLTLNLVTICFHSDSRSPHSKCEIFYMKQISRIISKLRNIDLQYHLLKNTGRSSYSEETSGKTLEFIGTSGVGKTTLFNESMNKRKNRWFFAYHLEFLKRKVPPCEIDDILMLVLKSRIENINNSDSFCPWHSLLDLKLSVRVMHETMLVVHSAHPKGFAFDEV